MSAPKTVRIVEVGPRDGLQNEKIVVPTHAKIQLIEQLANAGLTYIEAGSFVSPKWVPQMADSADVFTGIQRRPGVTYAALVPNFQGYERARAVDVGEIALFAAASEAFSQKNVNCSIAESLRRFDPIIARAKAENVRVRGYISCVVGCPYSGTVDPQTVASIARELLDMGCYEVSLGDTIGVGTAGHIKTLIDTVSIFSPVEKIAVHMHDTYGQPLTNIYAALDLGVSVVDSSIAGLGGCPYAVGASGNVATEDVVYLLNGLGIQHGIDLKKLIVASNNICQILGKPNVSKVAQAFDSCRIFS